MNASEWGDRLVELLPRLDEGTLRKLGWALSTTVNAHLTYMKQEADIRDPKEVSRLVGNVVKDATALMDSINKLPKTRKFELTGWLIQDSHDDGQKPQSEGLEAFLAQLQSLSDVGGEYQDKHLRSESPRGVRSNIHRNRLINDLKGYFESHFNIEKAAAWEDGDNKSSFVKLVNSVLAHIEGPTLSARQIDRVCTWTPTRQKE